MARSSAIYEYLAHILGAAKAAVNGLPIGDDFVAVTITLFINGFDRVLQRDCREYNQTGDEIFVRSECSRECRFHMRSR